MFEFILTVLFVSALTVGFYLSGRLLLRSLGLFYTESASVVIACGVAGVVGAGWYAYRLGVPFQLYIFAAVFLVLSFSARDIIVRLTCRKPLPKAFYAVLVLILAFSVQSLLCFRPMGISVGTIANSDFYHYSLLAEHLLGNAGYDNIISGVSATYHHPIDVFGVFFMLAVMSVFFARSALESTPVFTIFCLSMIGLAMFDVIIKMFRFKDSVALLISLLVTAGSFMFYIAYNGFYAQLLSIIFYLTAVCQILYVPELYRSGPLRTILFCALPFAGILLAFQAGFLVFSSCVVLFGIVYLLFSFPDKKMYMLIPIAGCLAALALFPEVAYYTVQRTMAVSSAHDGWPLPLLSPVYLLSIPVFAKFPGHIGKLSDYLVAFFAFAAVSMTAFAIYKKDDPEISRGYLASGLFFCVLMYAYLAAYAVRGNIYQVWKFASFVILPISFLFLSFVVLICQKKVADQKLANKVLVCVLACCVVFVVTLPARRKLEPLNRRIEGMKNARRLLYKKRINNLVLATEPWGETLMAFNVFSSGFKLFPLLKIYNPPADMSLIKELPFKESAVLADSGRVPAEYEVLRFSDLKNNGNYPLEGAAIGRSVLLGVRLGKGFSIPENWGVWADGYNAAMEAVIPERLSGKDIRVTFEDRKSVV